MFASGEMKLSLKRSTGELAQLHRLAKNNAEKR
eukprot:SAG11_NODE_2518_length_3265_cov_1.241314_1_plen_33_part_00